MTAVEINLKERNRKLCIVTLINHRVRAWFKFVGIVDA
jgi:hypothetical protein